MNGIVWTIAKKNLSKSSHLKSKVSMLTVFAGFFFVLSAILFLSSFMGDFQPDPTAPPFISSVSGCVVANAPESFRDFLSDSHGEDTPSFSFVQTDSYYDFVGINRLLREHSAYMALVFPDEFDDRLFLSDPEMRPQILSYYRTETFDFKEAHDPMSEQILDDYEAYLTERYGYISSSGLPFHFGQNGSMLSSLSSMAGGAKAYVAKMILPLILFVAALFISMESGVAAIAGEKENGTFSALLLTPVSKTQIVMGNILGIFIKTAMPCLGIVLLSVIGLGQIGHPFVLLSSTLLISSLILFLSALIVVVSILNKTVLAAQTTFLPVFLIMLVVCVISMNEISGTESMNFMLPFLGHFLGLGAAFMGEYSAAYLLIISTECLIMTAVLFFVSVRLLHTERFTTTLDATTDYKELRERARLSDPDKNYIAYPKALIFGYHATRLKSSMRLISYHFSFPFLLLAIIQPLALLIPAGLFLRSEESVVFIEKVAAMTKRLEIASVVQTSFDLFGLLMQEKAFILGMTAGYFLIVLIYIFVVKGIEKNSLSTIGLPLRGAGGLRKAVLSYLRGFLIGMVMISGVYAILLFAGQIKMEGFALSSSSLPLFFSYILMWIPQGASEEIMMRGYMMPRLAVRFGKAGGIGLTSLLFGLLHAGNIGFTPLALINLILIAAFFALLSWHTGEIFTVCAAHSAWNFAQGNVFGLSVSGGAAPAAILSSRYSDDAISLITGGNFGPEGGLAVTVIAVAAIIWILLLGKHSGKPRKT
ncbi:MAG: ABC transporter permease [Clostridiaceae bacterium]|nr:ABC transporter permease [Clostridiaceae bacterium]